jgi:hypothetical protein
MGMTPPPLLLPLPAGAGDLWVEFRQYVRAHLTALAAGAADAGAALQTARPDAHHDAKAALARAIVRHDEAVAAWTETEARLVRIDREVADAVEAARQAGIDEAKQRQARAALLGAGQRLVTEVTAARDTARALAALVQTERAGGPPA